MKKIIIIISLCIFLASCASVKELFSPRFKKSSQVNTELVPSAVQGSFKQKFPEKTVCKWFKIKNYLYVAQIKCNLGKKYAFFSNTGNFISKEDLELYDYNLNSDQDQDRYNDFMEDRDSYDNERD
jgi:hypothetical protein